MARPRKNPLPDTPLNLGTPVEAEMVVKSEATVEPAQEPSILDLIERASDAQKAQIRNALGVQATIKPPRRQTNADAVQVLAAHGGGTFQKTGFVPCPPQGVSSKGPAAEAKWLRQWEEGQTYSSRNAEIDADGIDAEALAATAVE
ncbi:hypothetical protein [uncultured Mediterranean phage uvDeep-CGR2-KM23-C246]|nr:hypothetical protein [uncultured Mediterranean phage uvDeep-CGR2-KM23-C246]